MTGAETDAQTEGQTAGEAAVPQAKIRTPEQVTAGKLKTRLWWLTAVCAVLAGLLVVSSFRSQGKTIEIQFQDGHGLKLGDTLRYRGIDVGSVTSVAISNDLAAVKVSIQLTTGNERVAVEGSQFWIERPRLKLGQVSGLETVLGAKFVGVNPGDPSGRLLDSFVGIETPQNIVRGDSAEIRIQFPAGEGLESGDTVRYRGISVGEVTYVELSESIDTVWVGVRLVGAARALARAGTQFWIERPRIDLTEIRGLETLIGGRYIAIQPTADNAEPQSEFTGLAEPPPLPRRDGSLEIELDAPNRLGLVRAAPITYRGLEVGRVSTVGLSGDGTTVKVNAVVDAEYADLVRTNSKWWAIGGIKMDANLRGVHIAVDSVSAWIRGGVAFATPENPGARVVTGHRFVLEAEPQAEWLDWQPRIAVGHSQAFGRELPVPVRVVASWQSSIVGLYRRRTAECWGIALSDRTLRVPAALVAAAQEANADVRIELIGQSIPFEREKVTVQDGLAKIPFPASTRLVIWPIAKVSSKWTSKSVLLVVNPELSEPLALDGTRLAVLEAGGIRIAPGVPLSNTLDGSPVVDSKTGNLVGLLTESDDGWIIGSQLDF